METPELIYVYDPLCGWCYGFSPVMQKIKDRFGDSLTYSVYTGGLVTGDRVGTVKDNFAFVIDGHKRVEELAGVMFGDDFKKNYLYGGNYEFNSVPPGKAFVILKEMKPGNAVEIAGDLQRAINWDGLSVYETATYTPIAEKHGIDTGVFLHRFNDPAYDSLLHKDFQMAQYYQAQGYPHVLLRKGEQYYLICRGYQGYEQVEGIIEGLLKGE